MVCLHVRKWEQGGGPAGLFCACPQVTAEVQVPPNPLCRFQDFSEQAMKRKYKRRSTNQQKGKMHDWYLPEVDTMHVRSGPHPTASHIPHQ